MNTAFRRLSVLLATFVIAAAAPVCFGVPAPASVKAAAGPVTSHIVKGGRGAKPVVKLSRDQANKNPKRLSSGKPRSGTLHINNHTEYYIDMYVDGDYSGTVAPYGDLYLYDSEDDVRVYGDVTGTSLYFGPREIGVPGVWNLYD